MDRTGSVLLENTHLNVLSNNVGAIDASIAPNARHLEDIFDVLNERIFENTLSKTEVVITLSETRQSVLGWCSTSKCWEDRANNRFYEINIKPELLEQSVDDVCHVLLHEMCHLYASLNGIVDCSRNSYYHNIEFKKIAEKRGLMVGKDRTYGFSQTSLKPETIELIKSLNLINFDLFRSPRGKVITEAGTETEGAKPQTPKSSTRKYICRKCELSVRATKEVRVRCDDCGELLVQRA